MKSAFPGFSSTSEASKPGSEAPQIQHVLIDKGKRIILPEIWEGLVKPGWHVSAYEWTPQDPVYVSPPSPPPGQKRRISAPHIEPPLPWAPKHKDYGEIERRHNQRIMQLPVGNPFDSKSYGPSGYMQSSLHQPSTVSFATPSTAPFREERRRPMVEQPYARVPPITS